MSRTAIAEMAAYTLELREAAVKLNQNESAFDVPRTLKEELFRRVIEKGWNRYPEFELSDLRSALARFCGLGPENILVGNGSNELLAATVSTFVGLGTPVVVPRPSFALYEKLVTIAGGTVVPVSVDPVSGLLPLDDLLSLSSPSSVVILCSPNNPTGGVLPAGGIEKLLATGATVLYDRAYGDFAGEEAIVATERLVTFSTFSKAWGLAGLRVGWLAAGAGTCREIRKVKLPYSLNIVSEAAAILLLENPWLRDQNVEHVKRERARVVAELKTLVEVFPTQANFVTFRAPHGTFDGLCACGVLVRDVSAYPGLANSLRVSIGSEEENDTFLAAIKELV